MYGYKLTGNGERIADGSGIAEYLEDFVDRSGPERDTLALLENCLMHTIAATADCSDPAIGVIIDNLAQYKVGDEETYAAHKGLAINSDRDSWGYPATIWTPGTLFPIHTRHGIRPATIQDQLVLSGAVGALYAQRYPQIPIFQRERASDFGFTHHIKACAFAGACIMDALFNRDMDAYLAGCSQFSYTASGFENVIFVGSTMDGDFRISAQRTPTSKVIAPTWELTEFRPNEQANVIGYHSVEPSIVAALVTATCMTEGPEAAIKLVGELEDKMRELTEESEDVQTHTSLMSAFGDRGGSDDFESQRLYDLLQGYISGENWAKRVHEDGIVLATITANNASEMQVRIAGNGIVFENVSTEQKATPPVNNQALLPHRSVPIPRSHYGELFGSLVRLSQNGLKSRTAPTQLQQVLREAKSVLSEPR